MKLLLASASPARKQTLISAGITPLVKVSHVPEDQLLTDLRAAEANPSPAKQVQLLATAKANDVATQILQATNASKSTPSTSTENLIPRVVVGCDSMFAFSGTVVGKPHTPEISRKRLHEMSGNYGELYTGHCVIDMQTGAQATGVSCARVYISQMTEAEIEAYISTGEPLGVAGSFTIDGFGGPFVERIEGDHHGVVGISLPLLRNLLAELQLSIVDFWDLRQNQQN